MLPCDMGKTVDDPGSLVESAIAECVSTACSRTALVVGLDERQVRLVDGVEHILPPCY